MNTFCCQIQVGFYPSAMQQQQAECRSHRLNHCLILCQRAEQMLALEKKSCLVFKIFSHCYHHTGAVAMHLRDRPRYTEHCAFSLDFWREESRCRVRDKWWETNVQGTAQGRTGKPRTSGPIPHSLAQPLSGCTRAVWRRRMKQFCGGFIICIGTKGCGCAGNLLPLVAESSA